MILYTDSEMGNRATQNPPVEVQYWRHHATVITGNHHISVLLEDGLVQLKHNIFHIICRRCGCGLGLVWLYCLLWWILEIYFAYFLYVYFTGTHYSDVIMSTMASQITASAGVQAQIKGSIKAPPLAFARGIHRSPVYSPRKGPVTQKMFPFDDVIMCDYHPIKNV